MTVVCSHSHMTRRRVSESPVTSHHRGAVAGQEPEHQDGVGHDEHLERHDKMAWTWAAAVRRGCPGPFLRGDAALTA